MRGASIIQPPSEDRELISEAPDREFTGKVGGRGGIRTHGRVAPTPDFESGAFNHSATLPTARDFSLTPL